MVKKNNKENGRVLRVVSIRGRYRLMWATVDAEGEVEHLLPEEDIDFSFKDYTEMKELIALVEEAKMLPIITVNSSNRSLYILQDYQEE